MLGTTASPARVIFGRNSGPAPGRSFTLADVPRDARPGLPTTAEMTERLRARVVAGRATGPTSRRPQPEPPTTPSARRAVPSAVERAHPPTMRGLDDKHRVTYRGLGARLGFAGATFEVRHQGPWVVLVPAAAPAPARTHHQARLSADDRLTIPAGVRARLGVAAGDEVLIAVLAGGRLALAHPSVVYLGAPLEFDALGV